MWVITLSRVERGFGRELCINILLEAECVVRFASTGVVIGIAGARACQPASATLATTSTE